MTAFTGTGRGRKWLLGSAALLLLAGAVGAYLWWRPRPPAPPEIPLEGVEAEVAEVVKNARARVLKNPQSGAAWGLLGRTLLANELPPDIYLFCFQEAERLDPSNPRWPYFCGGALLNLGKRKEALPSLRRAVELCERGGGAQPTPRLQLAETLLSLNHTAAAESEFQRVLSADPNNARAHFNLAVLACARGEWEAGRAHLEACLGDPQARKKACAHLATVCERLGDKQNADKYATLAARLPKDYGWTDPFVAEHVHLATRKRDRYRVVEHLEAGGRFPQAAAILAHLVAEYPDDYLPHLMLGRILPQMGQFQPAEQHLHKARELAPDKIQVYYLLSLVYFKEGEALGQAGDRAKAKARFEASVKSARHVLALQPDFGYAHMALGLSLKHLGRRAEAITAFRQAVHCNPDHADNHLFLGIALAEEGNARVLPLVVAGTVGLIGPPLGSGPVLAAATLFPGRVEAREARASLEQARLLAAPNDPRPKAALERFFPKGAPKAKT